MIENKFLIPVTPQELEAWTKFEAALSDPIAHESRYRGVVGEANYIPNPRLRLDYQNQNVVQLINAPPTLRPRQPARQKVAQPVG